MTYNSQQYRTCKLQQYRRSIALTVKESRVRGLNSRRSVFTKLTLVALALTACLIFSSAAPAALQHAGDLDPAFGSGGTVFTSSGFVPRCNQVFIQSDGKIVAVGLGGGPKAVFAA